MALSFVWFFCVPAAYYMIRPVREQLAAAVGSTQLPWFYLATFIATLALTPVFAMRVSRYPRRIVVPLAVALLLAVLLSGDPYAPVIGAMPWVAIALIVSRGLVYGMVGPGREPVHAGAAQPALQGQECGRYRSVEVRRCVGGADDECLPAVGVGVAGFAALSALAAAASGAIGWRARQVEPRDLPRAPTPRAA